MAVEAEPPRTGGGWENLAFALIIPMEEEENEDPP
jgi:hypothetical protein